MATRMLTYYIVLTDPVLVKQYQTQFPNGYQFAPFNPLDGTTGQPGGAAVAFSAPWAGSYPGTDPHGGTYTGPAPYTWSPEWISANNYDQSVASFTRKTGGFWGLGGTTTTYYWVGQFVLAEPATPTVGGAVPTPSPMPNRHFIEGFEFGNASGLITNGDSGQHFSRDASRHVGQMGLALRGPASSSMAVNHDGFGAALTNKTWTRLYVRLRLADPVNTVIFWGSRGSVSSSEGVNLGITPDGRVACFFSDVSANRTLVATSTQQFAAWNGQPNVSGWHKIDILLHYNALTVGSPPPNDSTVQVYIDGVLAITAAGFGTNGSAQNHKQSFVGTPQVSSSLYLDVDDWMAADRPIDGGEDPALEGRDWLQGTKIVPARAKSFGAGHANWTGDVRLPMQNPMSTTSTAGQLASTTAGAIAEVVLDTDQCVDRDPGKTGVLSFMVHTVVSCATSGTLGYILNAAAPVMAAIVEGGALTAFAVLKSLTAGSRTYPTFTSLSARHIKSADANAAAMTLLGASIELVGLWGPEDYRVSEGPAPVFPRYVGQHNAPYPFSVYAKGTSAPPPNAPVIIHTGTYVGNGTGQDLLFRAPVHLLFIRPVTGGGGGVSWWSTMLGSHLGPTQQGLTPQIAKCDEDTTFVPGLGVDVQQQRYRVRIGGNNAALNAIGVSYAFTAFCDPGQRFLLCGQMSHKTTQPTIVDNLIDSGFTPECGLFLGESPDNSSTAALYYKGLGVAAGVVLRSTTSAQLAAALDLGAGQLTSQAALHALNSGIGMPFALWRRHDGNADPGEPGVIALATWTGDGSASRTISLAPTSGLRPAFVMVFASDTGGMFFRDTQHLTTHSCTNTGADTTTGITGGAVDSFSVGASLNVNGTTYSAFVLFGGATGAGFSDPTENVPVSPAPPFVDPTKIGPYPPTPPIVVPTPPTPTPLIGEPDLDATTVLSDAGTNLGGLVGGQACEYYTRHVVNMALSRIGVSAPIANLATELSQAAVTARRHVLEDINQVLRDFDWPFATRYATLVLVGGTSTVPVNVDWQYSYRAPGAMMKARRLCGQGGQQRSYDPNPPKFILGADAIGPLVFTNEVATTAMPLVLEYTVRQICPALYGDALFRDALAWKFAFSLAPVLSKDTKKQEYCRQMYERAISIAKVPAAQEQQQPKPGQADWINAREGWPFHTGGWPWDRNQ